jgi:hypothetical protein
LEIKGYEEMSRKTTIFSMPRRREWVTCAFEMNVNAKVRGNIFGQ